jgi:hypothetical protein
MQMTFDELFRRHGHRRDNRRDPMLEPQPGRSLVCLEDASPTATGRVRSPADIRPTTQRMSPRQLAEWAYEMYLGGALAWDEYCLAGFPAELHPDYNRTIGALTGSPAQPDAPRDMVREWESRLDFALRHRTAMAPLARQTEKVLDLLRRSAARAGQRSS